MTITNYIDLQSTIAEYAKRSDLSAKIPTFITLAEARINRLLNLSTTEVEVALVMTIGSRFISLPANANTPIAAWDEYVQPRRLLTPVIPQDLPVNNTYNSLPTYWCVDGANLAFEVGADKAYPISFRYKAAVSLSVSAPTNTVLTNCPDAYLYGSLWEQAINAYDDNSAAKWKAHFEIAIQQINDDSNANKSIAPLMTDLPIPLQRGGKSSILRGY